MNRCSSASLPKVSGMQVQLSLLQEDMQAKEEIQANGPTPLELAHLAALSCGGGGAVASHRLAVCSTDADTPSKAGGGGAPSVDSPNAFAWPNISYILNLANTAMLAAKAEGVAQASAVIAAYSSPVKSPFADGSPAAAAKVRAAAAF